MPIYLVTGQTGVGKTNLTLTDFLKPTEVPRPKFATHIPDFDYEKAGVTKIEHMSDWVNCPDGSLIFIDEVQTFARAQVKASDIPDWLTNLETHRHRGIDFYLTTQNPAFVHIHVRRLAYNHIHYTRPMNSRLIVKRTWSKCVDDPNDSRNYALPDNPVVTEMVKLNKDTFGLYKSTEMDTLKFKLPKKFIIAPLIILAAIILVFFLIKPLWQKFSGASESVDTTTSETTVTTASDKLFETPQLSSSSPQTYLASDFNPVADIMPWTAPVYAQAVKITDVPVFSGCIQRTGHPTLADHCTCFSQQGTRLTVDLQTCESVASGNSFPFNPFKTHLASQQQQQPQAAQGQGL